MKPYNEVRQNDVIYRKFDKDVDNHELVWHRDKENRKVEVLDGDGWLFQFDNQIPFELKKGVIFEIEKETYHRVIKGESPLTIKIVEY